MTENSDKKKLTQLSLDQLLGSTLTSIIDAQRQSLEVTRDFIEEFGFEKNGENLGKLKTITFQYHTAKGEKQVSIPLLSLFPIPMLKIKDAEIDFDLKISSIQKTTISDCCQEEKIKLSGAIAPSSRLSQQKLSAGTAQISVKVNLVEEDVTPGLTNFYNLMAGATTTENIPKQKNVENTGDGPGDTEPEVYTKDNIENADNSLEDTGASSDAEGQGNTK